MVTTRRRAPLLAGAILILSLIVARGLYVDLTAPPPTGGGGYAAAAVSGR